MSWFQFLTLFGIAFVILMFYQLIKELGSIKSYFTEYIYQKHDSHDPTIGERLEEIQKQLLCIRFDIPFVTLEDKKYIDSIDNDSSRYDAEYEVPWNERIDKKELYGEDWKAEILETLNDVKNLLEEIRKDSIALNDISDELGEIKDSLKK